MAVLIKDIRLKSAIGNWYEYKPDKNYTNDFATANIEAAQIDELLELHHKWAEGFGALINQSLKISCGTQETAVSKLKYTDFVNHLPGTTTSFEVDSNPDFTVVMDNALTYAFLDRACGGGGAAIKKLNAELTEIEKSVLSPLMQEMLNSYKTILLDAPVGKYAPGEMSSPKIKPETKLKKDDDVLVFANTFYLADNKPAEVQFIYTEKSLEKLWEIYNAKKILKPKKLTLHLSPEDITNVKVPVNVKIGSTIVTINEIMNMVPGDVFQLREKVTDSLVMSVAEQGEFFVQLGRRSDKFAVKVVEHKSKYYSFAPSVPAQAAVAEKPVQRMPAEARSPQNTPEALVEPEIPTVEINEPVQLRKPAAPEVEYTAAQQTVDDEDSAQRTADGKVDAEKLEIKDSLLDELELPETAESNDGDDFTWDIDDLK